MVEPILDPDYWRGRLAQSKRELHRAIFRCPREVWDKIAAEHRAILSRVVQNRQSVLDAGCGWGRLLDLLPRDYRGSYLGVDLSPAFIDKARQDRPLRQFMLGTLPQCLGTMPDNSFDWAVAISMQPMITNNLGEAVWGEIETELKRVARRVLILEYKVGIPGRSLSARPPYEDTIYP